MRKHKQGKTPFKSGKIRKLEPHEFEIHEKITAVISGELKDCIIATIPGFISFDGRERVLVFSAFIALKILGDHGTFHGENLLVSANEWDFIVKNIQGNPDKINLIKIIPETGNFLLIGAIRDNGFFMLTHFETIVVTGNELKNLLKRGDALDRSGRTASL